MNRKTFFGLSMLSLLALSACGNGSSSDKIVLRIGFWPDPSETQDVAMYEEWAAEFEADYPQYDIQGAPYTYSTDTVGQKAAAGQLPDVWQTWFTEPEKLMSKGIIRGIGEQLSALGWDEKMDDEMKAALTFDGDIYGIPRDGYGLGLLINKRILGENGLLPEDPDNSGSYLITNEDGTPAYPTTWEEVYEMGNTIVNENGDSSKGFLMYSANKNGGWVFSNIAWNYGAELEVEEDGAWKANLTCDEAVQALEWIQKMKQDGIVQDTVSCVYNDWYSSIGDKVAMAVVGSDVLQNAKLLGDVDMSDLAFVPMPTGDGTHHYSLYGGTPFVFTDGISDEKEEGILLFFNYIGRSPETSETNLAAIKTGFEVAKAKGQPILPTISPWKDEEFLTQYRALEESYINVDMTDYSPFFDSIAENKHSEVPYNAQEMYKYLDTAIQSIFENPDTANASALLTTASNSLQKDLDDGVNA